MLTKLHRIKKKKDFDDIFKKGGIFKSKTLIFRFLKNNLGFDRAGFVTSQKVSKKAVVRNKIRRRLSEAVGQNLRIKTEKGIDLVLIAQPGIEKEDFTGIKNIIDKFFQKNV